MRKKALMVFALMFVAGLVFAWGSNPSLTSAQDDTPTLYEDEYYEPTLYEDDFYEDDFFEDDDFYFDAEYELTDPVDLWAFMMSYMLILCCMGLPVYIFVSLTLYTIGKKVGEDHAWMAWVPILNVYYMVKVAGLSGWMFILLFIPFVQFFFAIYVWMEIFKRRGFNEWLALLMLIPIVNFVMMGYVAWAEPSGGSSSNSSTETVVVSDEPTEAVAEVEVESTDTEE